VPGKLVFERLPGGSGKAVCFQARNSNYEDQRCRTFGYQLNTRRTFSRARSKIDGNRMPLRITNLVILAVCLDLANPRMTCVGAGLPKEREIEAVLLLNLTRFVEWPTNAVVDRTAMVIGLIGRDPFGDFLSRAVAGERVNGKPILVEHCQSIQQALSCQVVFISSSERSRCREIVAHLKGHSVLTVSDMEDFARLDGGMIAFYVNAEHKVRLRLNVTSARAEQLSFSSKLIQVSELERPNAAQPYQGPPGLQLAAGTGKRPIFVVTNESLPSRDAAASHHF
jgi:hypothetical protein